MPGTARPWPTVAARLAFAILCSFGCLLASACTRTPDSSPRAAPATVARPDILLVTIDTLRADHLGSYGYHLPTSPFIDRLAAGGVRFERAYSTSSWTVPAVVSMLTSTYPSRHGMGQRTVASHGQWHVTPAGLPSLPEALSAAGYRTYGFTANFGLPAERGFSRGFDRYRCIGAVDVEAIEDELERWLPDLQAGSPWFFWLHLFDAHAPYTGREPWLSTLYPETAASALERGTISAAMVEPNERTAATVDRAQQFYDSEIRRLDHYLERLFERIPRSDDALVLLTADHGEEFLDHGDVLHGRNLYNETLRIPFIVRFPDRRFAGRIVSKPVSLIDVLPTLLTVAGAPVPAEAAGADLVATILESRTPAPRSIFAELESGRRQRAVTDGRWKYVITDHQESAPLLFDLDHDPGESNDLLGSRPELELSFRHLLAAYERARPTAPAELTETEITSDQAEALRTLGYIQ